MAGTVKIRKTKRNRRVGTGITSFKPVKTKTARRSVRTRR